MFLSMTEAVIIVILYFQKEKKAKSFFFFRIGGVKKNVFLDLVFFTPFIDFISKKNLAANLATFWADIG